MKNNIIEKNLKHLRCPQCMQQRFDYEQAKVTNTLLCRNCKSGFALSGNTISMLSPAGISDTKKKSQEFWGDICKQWYSDFDKTLTQDKLYEYLEDLEGMFRQRKHMAVTEMPIKCIAGKDVLEIGSGGGAHSALFKKYGAHIISVDITPERVVSTGLKLSKVSEGAGLAIQADAENLPFADSSFDIIYSNGVLHHSEDTVKCINEVFRTLKPGGLAVIMLYSRHSALYWCSLLPKTVLSGLIFKYPEAVRIGLITEGKPKYGSTKNPITRIYSKKEIKSLFSSFEILSLRKSSFNFSQIPFWGRLRMLFFKLSKRKPWKSGTIVYGEPYHAETRLELLFSPALGFGWNIVARKKSE